MQSRSVIPNIFYVIRYSEFGSKKAQSKTCKLKSIKSTNKSDNGGQTQKWAHVGAEYLTPACCAYCPSLRVSVYRSIVVYSINYDLYLP